MNGQLVPVSFQLLNKFKNCHQPLIAISLVILLSSYVLTYESIDIDHYREPVSLWDGPWMSYRIINSNDEVVNWVLGINDFQNYRWGYKYKLRVRKRTILNPPLDSPSSEYKLIKIVSMTKIEPTENFSITLKEDLDSNISLKDDRLLLMNEIDIVINDNSMREKLIASLPFSRLVKGRFSHDGEGKIILQDFQYEFDRNLAIHYVEPFLDEDQLRKIDQWKESDFFIFQINNNRSKE